jgi:hypothetical protein
MPLPLKLLGFLLFAAVAAIMVLGQLRGPFLGPVIVITAGLLVLLGLCLLTDFRRSADWLGQHAKENASVYFNAVAPDKGVYRGLGLGIAALGVAIGTAVFVNMPI